jgi:hypothetical protein
MSQHERAARRRFRVHEIDANQSKQIENILREYKVLAGILSDMNGGHCGRKALDALEESSMWAVKAISAGPDYS